MKVLGRIFVKSRKERRTDVETERWSFFVRCRRTYVLKKALCLPATVCNSDHERVVLYILLKIHKEYKSI